MRIATCCGIFGLGLASAACVSTAPQSFESIMVSQQTGVILCTGNCPDNDVTVFPDGRVTVQRPSAVFHSGLPKVKATSIQSFKVSRADAAAFREKLRPFRPSYDWYGPVVCNQDVAPQDAWNVLKLPQIQVTWSDADGRKRRLQGCVYGGGGLDEAIRQALWSVHLYVTGYRRD